MHIPDGFLDTKTVVATPAGTSGHLVGSVLPAVLLGPSAAVVDEAPMLRHGLKRPHILRHIRPPIRPR